MSLTYTHWILVPVANFCTGRGLGIVTLCLGLILVNSKQLVSSFIMFIQYAIYRYSVNKTFSDKNIFYIGATALILGCFLLGIKFYKDDKSKELIHLSDC